MRNLLSALVVGALFATPTLAEDRYPPPWRGDPGSTFQHWTFDFPQGPDWFPEFVDNAYGDPYMHTDFGSEIWFPDFEGMQGVIVTSDADFVFLEIPNVPLPNAYKEIWVQVTFMESFPYGADHPMVELFEPPGYQFDRTVLEWLFDTPNGSWHYAGWHVEIPFNPDQETIALIPFGSIGPNMIIDQIVVDTICVPQPSALAVLMLGGLSMARRRQ